MKRIAFVLAVLATLVACGTKPQFSGTLHDIEGDFLLFVYSSEGDSGEMAMDTVYLDNGKFQFNAPQQENGVLMIVDPGHFINYMTLYVKTGEHCIINGSLTDYEISGSRFYEDWGAFHKMAAGNVKARQELMASIPEEEDPDYDMAAYSARDRALKAQSDSLSMEFIRNNPGSDLCAYLAYELSLADDFYAAEEIISDKVTKGPLGYLIERKVLSLDAEALRQASMKDIYEGAVAPDFTLPTATGESFTLSDHRGGWVMLDFWGTWCGWCVEGLPTVKEIAHTYADRLTVVSVDCGDTETAWKKGIEQYGMDWTQVYNSKADAVDSRFAVQGYPGFYVINPEGVIVMMSFGEPAHFVEKIGEIIGK